jgi:hypothetical protein
MCQQLKMGYTDCPHVACDLQILKCSLAIKKRSCTFKRTNIPDIVWLETQEVGKCHFCILEGGDKKLEKERAKRALRSLDLENNNKGARKHYEKWTW